MSLFSHFSFSDILNIFDPSHICGAFIWGSLCLFVIYSVLFDKGFPLNILPSVGELHSLLVPYSLPPAEKLTIKSIAQGLDSGKYHNVVVLMGAG